MMDNAQRLDYLCEYYWDAFMDTSSVYPSDSTMLSGVAMVDVEQAIANYQLLVGNMELSRAEECVRRMALKTCQGDSAFFNGFSTLVEKYFYDPNSPLRDEDLYRPFATVMSECSRLEQSRRLVYSYQAQMCSCNRRGTLAADFRFTMADGRTKTLYGVKAPYTVLFFSNPGCTACKEIIDALGQLEAQVNAGLIAVVNVYIDEDLKEWYDYMDHYPSQWYNGYDADGAIRADELYNVRAIPSLYLLDAEKNVMLKDVPTERLFNTLENILRQ